MAENRIEKGEYVIGIAVIIAAILIAATLFVGVGNINKAISGLSTAQAPAQDIIGAQNTTTAASSLPLANVNLNNVVPSGNSNGNVMMVEYSDYQCPYCGQAYPTIKQVLSNYNNVDFVFKQFPLTSIHQYAEKAAEASLCAGNQGQFWAMHDTMYNDQSKLSVSDLEADAGTLGMNTTEFNSCLENGQMATQVSTEESEGAALGIEGTPGFLVFSKSDTGAALQGKLGTLASQLQSLGATATVVQVNGAGDGIVFSGALPYANFQQVMAAFQ